MPTLLAGARAAGVKIACAESCTGGMVAVALTDTGRPSRHRYQHDAYTRYAEVHREPAGEEQALRPPVTPFEVDRQLSTAPVATPAA